MNTCPTCGHDINSASTILVYSDGIIVDDRWLPLTRNEMKIMEILERAMHRGPVNRGEIIDALYTIDADEPETAINLLRVFICKLRKKLEGTSLRIMNHYDFGYSLVYETRKAA